MSEGWLARVRAAAVLARATGTLVPLTSTLVEVDEAGIRFQVRRLQRSPTRRTRPPGPDPFLSPYENGLHVGDLGGSHRVLLNKYPILGDHLLLVTQVYADQEAPPDAADWEALEAILPDLDGVAFYNGGRAAGASQPHRHIQVVSREAYGTIPVETAIVQALRGGLRAVPGWPFRHAIAHHPTFATMRELLVQVGRDPVAPGPHSIASTRDWMLIVPRRAAEVQQIPVNTLGYLGSLIVLDDRQLEVVCRSPFQVLAQAGEPMATLPT